MKDRILLVDDEENILAGYRRNLRAHFDIHTSTEPIEALNLINTSPPFAVVVSDFRMPGMDGNEFLSLVRKNSPDSVRVMLTGYADAQTAIDAVNQGNIFRLLTKPCSTQNLLSTLNICIKQYKLIISERELLNKTLKGSIKVLTDILSVVNPSAFSQVTRFRSLAGDIAQRLGQKKLWEIEMAALLSNIGCVAVPSEILEKKINNKPLTAEETKLYNSHPQVGQFLLNKIPRLGEIARSISLQFQRFDGKGAPEGSPVGEDLPLSARILKVLHDYDVLIKNGKSSEEAIDFLRQQKGCYDPKVLLGLDAATIGIYDGLKLIEVAASELKPGVVLAEDIREKSGMILVTKGHEISDVLLMRIQNFVRMDRIQEPIRILVGESD